MIYARRFCTVVGLLILGAIATPAWAQPKPAAGTDASQPPSAGQSFATALSGLVTASNQQVQLERSVSRMAYIRSAFAKQFFGQRNIDLSTILDNSRLLCDPRKQNALLAADRTYLTAVSGDVQTTAAASKIDTLTAAIGVLFKSYSIEISPIDTKGAKAADAEKVIVDNCNADLRNYGDVFYQFRSKTGGIGDFLSPFSALLSAISAIVTPIATTAATMKDEASRQKAITDFLKGNKDVISSAIGQLNSDIVAFADTQRLLAAGSFAEQAALLRAETSQVDLSKIDACKKALTLSLPDVGTTPSDDLVLCFNAVWSKIASNVATTLKAADSYDQFADASNSDQGKTIKSLQDQLTALANPNPKPSLTELWNDAVKLVAFGQALNSALSQSNRDAVQKAIDGLVKAF